MKKNEAIKTGLDESIAISAQASSQTPPDIDTLSAIKVAAEPIFDFRSDEYRSLFEASTATAFQGPDWLHEFYETLAPSCNAEKIIITGRDVASGKLHFVLPLIQRRMKGIFLLESADLGVCDYSCPVIEPSSRDLLDIKSNLHQDIAKAIGRFDILRLKAIRNGSQDLWGLFFKGQALQLDFSSHEVILDKPFDEWRTENFDKKHRTNLNYRMRRFHKKHTEITFETVPDDQVGAVIDKIQQLRVGRFVGDPIQHTCTRKFYRAVAIKGQTGQFSKTHQLVADGKFVGAMFGLTYNGRHHGMLMACDYEKYGEFAPAFNMIDMLMANWQKEGGNVIDFDIGDEPYKPKFGTKPIKLFRILRANSILGTLALKICQLTGKTF